MKLTYIYLTEEEKTKAMKQCAKNHVSLSTLADVVIFYTYHAIMHYATDKEITEKIKTEYLYPNRNVKTSIKPKCYKEGEAMERLIKEKDKYATNCLKIYINKLIDNYITEEGKNDYYNKINNRLNEIKEQFWNYNNFVRSQRRNLKDNKEYYKREIARLENS